MADRFNNSLGTAARTQELKNERLKLKFSNFDLSRMHYTQGIIGAIMPVCVIPVLPNDRIKLNFGIMAELRNPTIRPIKTGIRIYTHAYAMNSYGMWEGFPLWKDKGIRGNYDLHLPTWLDCPKVGDKEHKAYTWLTPNSPLNYMGVPFEAVSKTRKPIFSFSPVRLNDTNTLKRRTSDKSDTGINVLPLVMYQRVCRDYYFNANLCKDSQMWFPDDEHDFKLPKNCQSASVLQYGGYSQEFQPNTIQGRTDGGEYKKYFLPQNTQTTTYNYDFIWLNALRFRQWNGDMFTSGNPFAEMMRGDTPVVNAQLVDANIDWTAAIATEEAYTNRVGLIAASSNENKTDATLYATTNATTKAYDIDSTLNSLTTALNKVKINELAKATFNMNDLRKLAAITKYRERLAKVNQADYYNGVSMAEWEIDPKYMNDEAPLYLGGFYQDFTPTAVTNQTESEQMPLGYKGGQGGSVKGGNLGEYHAKDFGYVMVCITIVPDKIYNKSLDRWWFTTLKEELPSPLLTGLEPQATFNKEMIWTGVKENDNKTLNWVDRYIDWKTRRNIVTGFAEDDFFEYDRCQFIMDKTPLDENGLLKFNNEMVSMWIDSIDRTPFMSKDEPEFDLTIQENVSVIRALPYESKPSDMGYEG